jgi:hypothetical protein
MLPLPSQLLPKLLSVHLQTVAGWLIEELYATADDLVRFTDTPYTKGCTTFGRQLSRIKAEAISGKHDWLSLASTGNDLVFTINGIPCRFSNDDPSNPSKEAVLSANRYQLSLMEQVSEELPVRLCFVIDRGRSETEDARVEFLGFSNDDQLRCRWVSDALRVQGVIAQTLLPLPAPVPVARPHVAPKRNDQDGTIAAQTQ